ncbi:MAG: iron ABC transporter permease [Spirochaetales bacterium]|jgi:iron(III) transport system permease protein|nr:iron ABC transporter permease [Spirochaetales bacterium]
MLKKFSLPDFWKALTVIIILVFALFLVYPLFSLFLSSFKDPETGGWTFDNFVKFFSRRFYYTALWNSFLVTGCVTVLTVLIGIPMAYFMTSFKIRGKTALEILIIISMMSPAFIGAYSWVLLGGRNGVITKFLSGLFGIQTPSIYGFGGILLVFTLKLYPFIYMYASGALKKIDVSLGEAAESLGCGSVRKVATIIVPLITPTILAGALLVFMNALADFGTPMLIGEGYRTMPVLIYSEFIGEVGGSANFAASMATIMVFVTAVMFIGQKHFVNKKSYTMSALRPIQPKEITGFKSVCVHAFLFIVIGLSIIPQLTVIYTSFLNTNQAIFLPGFSLVSYKMIFSNLGSAIRNTYLFGLIAILLIVLLGLFIAYLSVRRRNFFTGIIDSLTMFPYIIPGSVLGITLLLAFNDEPLILSGTAFIIILSLVIRRLPYTLRSSSAILYQISPSIEEASISLGASPVKTFFRITAVMMLPGVLSGAILSWITVINELSSSVILYTAGTRTMSVAVYQEVVRASYGTAAALATILTATTVISLILFYKLTGKKEVNI